MFYKITDKTNGEVIKTDSVYALHENVERLITEGCDFSVERKEGDIKNETDYR